jgi:KDO2-lipid IV(A) lauroyltransferase
VLLYLAYKIGQVLTLIFPLKFSYWLGSRIADMHYANSKKDREIVLNNLRHICGDRGDLEHLARSVFRNFAKYLAEFLRVSRMDERYIKRKVEFEGIENLTEVLKQKKGAVLFSAHLGNWEWGAALVAYLGFPISAIVLAHKHKNVNDFFINQRTIKGIGSIPLGGSVRRSMKLLAANETVAILADRDFSNNSVPVDFFGKKAMMPVGCAIFAIKNKSPLVPVFIARQGNDRHKLTIEKPLELDLTGKKEDDIKKVVQATTNVIERYVRMHPEQWFMFADPWKEAAKP